jgi:hypothetical protein
MKRTLLAGLLATLSINAFNVNADTLPQSNVMGNNAAIGLGFSSNEGESGYYADLHWQFNKYADISIGVNSYLNGQRFESETLLGADAALFTPESFRPRHNLYQFSTTFRYPFVLSNDTILAPYAELGISKLSTKTLVFVENVESEPLVERKSFGDLDSFKFGVGIQMAFNGAHKLTLGAIGYSNDEDFTQLSVDDNEIGGTLRYEYRPGDTLGYILRLDTVDQFGGALFNIGVSWNFN